MSLTFIHLSDTHLGFCDLDHQDEEGNYIREQDVYKAFSDAVDIILEEKPDFVLHTGDIFHRSSPSNRTLVEAFKQISRIASEGIPFYMIAGNHDFPKSIFTSPVHDLYKISDLVKIVHNEELEVISKENFSLHLLPHINSENKFLEEVDKIKITDNSKPNILAMHIAMPHYLMEEVGERVFPADKIDTLKDFDYTALGHWHRFNHLKKYGNVFYCGSTERTSDTQTGYEKGVIKVKIDRETTADFIPLTLRTYEKIKVENCWEKSTEEIIAEIKSTISEETIKNGIFHIRLIDLNEMQNNIFTRSFLEDIFEKALYYKLIKSVKGSEEKFEIDGDSFDLKEFFFDDLSEKFDGEDFTKVKNLSQKLWDEIEEEEANANQ